MTVTPWSVELAPTGTVTVMTKVAVWPAVKVIVGGAPVTGSFADAIGADGYAESARAAVDLARRLIGLDVARRSKGELTT